MSESNACVVRYKTCIINITQDILVVFKSVGSIHRPVPHTRVYLGIKEPNIIQSLVQMRTNCCATRLKAIKRHPDNHNCSSLRAKLRANTSPNLLSAFSRQIGVLYITWKDVKSIKSHNSQCNMYQSSWYYRSVSQCGRGLLHVTTSDEAGLSKKIFPILISNIKWHLISWYTVGISPSGFPRAQMQDKRSSSPDTPRPPTVHSNFYGWTQLLPSYS